jgi:hypothetical protein
MGAKKLKLRRLARFRSLLRLREDAVVDSASRSSSAVAALSILSSALVGLVSDTSVADPLKKARLRLF